MFISETLSPTQIIRDLGLRFRDCRMRLNMTQKEVSEQAAISIPTIYKFETGQLADISMTTLLKLMRTVGMGNNWQDLLPLLPESPYLYHNNKKRQRIRK